MRSPKSDRPWTPTQSCLLPPSPLEWLPKEHLAYFVLDLIAQLDLSAIEDRLAEMDPRGERPYPPAMMLALLPYGYATGVYSSRRIARATYEDVAFRVLAGDPHPYFTTINEFRLQHREVIAEPPFGQIQEARCLAHDALKLFRALIEPLGPAPGARLMAMLAAGEAIRAPVSA